MSHMRIVGAACALAATLVYATPAIAAPGDTDPGFGPVRLDHGRTNTMAADTFVQPDGKVAIVGNVETSRRQSTTVFGLSNGWTK